MWLRIFAREQQHPRNFGFALRILYVVLFKVSGCVSIPAILCIYCVCYTTLSLSCSSRLPSTFPSSRFPRLRPHGSHSPFFKVCTNVHRISTDVNDWNAECRNTKVRDANQTVCCMCVYVFGVRSVKIRHSCNFPVVSCTINQADAWLRQEDGFCVVYLFCFAFLPCLTAPHLSHLTSFHFSHHLAFALAFFSRSFSLTLSRCLHRVQDVVRNIILKRNQTKRN